MIKDLRNNYNKLFRQENYESFINYIQELSGGLLDFRVSETPLFCDEKFTLKLIEASALIIDKIKTSDFLEFSNKAVPEKYYIPNETTHPLFFQIDFGVAENINGEILPQLIELQGFPSLYAYQAYLAKAVDEKLAGIPEGFVSYFNGLDFNSYLKLLNDSILGGHNPKNVVLLEIAPELQKTRIDFHFTKQISGIEILDVDEVYEDEHKLYYFKGNERIYIERIYNRVIFDEAEAKNVRFSFNYKKPFDVEWAGHPNWFFRLSKHTLPFLKNDYVPESFFLNDVDINQIVLEDFVLKPLFSFAGSGVKIDISKEDIERIENPENYILQKKVNYLPIIETPAGNAKAEIRMMFIWDKEPILVNNLLRTSKGKMMGVDFNKGKTWIGSNLMLHPEI